MILMLSLCDCIRNLYFCKFMYLLSIIDILLSRTIFPLLSYYQLNIEYLIVLLEYSVTISSYVSCSNICRLFLALLLCNSSSVQSSLHFLLELEPTILAEQFFTVVLKYVTMNFTSLWFYCPTIVPNITYVNY